MINNLKEAIEHAKEKATELKREAESIYIKELGHTKEVKACLECASEHEQLAEWLTELEADRKLIGVIRSIIWNNSLYDGIKIDKLRRLLPDCNVYPKYCKDCHDLSCPHNK